MADQSDQIQTNALAPAQAAVDGASAQQHPIPSQIAADRYKASAGALGKRRRGLRFSKLIPPGPVSDQGGTGTGSGFDRAGC